MYCLVAGNDSAFGGYLNFESHGPIGWKEDSYRPILSDHDGGC